MKRTVVVKFKDGNVIITEPELSHYGWLDLGDGMTLIPVHGMLYKEKGNVICGEDITDTVDEIEVYMKY